MWNVESGFSNQMLESVDRWIESLLRDDEIDAPVSGGNIVMANIWAKQTGIVAGKAVIIRLFEKWASNINSKWFLGDGEQIQK